MEKVYFPISTHLWRSFYWQIYYCHLAALTHCDAMFGMALNDSGSLLCVEEPELVNQKNKGTLLRCTEEAEAEPRPPHPPNTHTHIPTQSTNHNYPFLLSTRHASCRPCCVCLNCLVVKCPSNLSINLSGPTSFLDW